MKKKVIICLSILFVLTIIVVTFFTTKKNEEPFYLENNYYGVSNMVEIKIDELNQLIDDKKSFAVFVYQPKCIVSSDFENVLSEYLEDNQVSIYKIAFSSIIDTNIGESVKYYPSFIIYKEGKMIDFLEADKDEDVEFYTSKEGFEKWFTRYVKIKNDLPLEN